MLCLHLIQASLVYVNTIMMQRVITDPKWKRHLGLRDLAALTPLVYHHVNPNDNFNLDLDTRLQLER